jgi:riboflavin kinase/FMN adenylyltransferase
VKVIRALEGCPRPAAGTAVTIGAYDGVHLGHQAVIAEVRRMAGDRTDGPLETAVVTFDRHPAMVVRPESAPLLLTDLDQKLELLEAAGVDHTLVIHFDEARAHEQAEDFVKEVLVDCLAARLVVVGEDFHFGRERKGDVALLERMGSDLGFDVDGLDLVGIDARPAATDEERVSSTAIRRALRAGELDSANRMLGRQHEVRGDILLPADGIYAGWFVRADGEQHQAAISLGRRPTFYEQAHASLLEAHLLDFDGDLYGEHVRVRFARRLRGEVKFDSVDALIDQIARDCEDASTALAAD